jgi:organic hydroperoxide reductase OsmC/OhrA
MVHERTAHEYRVEAWSTSDGTGIAKSDTTPTAIHFSAPPEYGGLEGQWTPEELLLASITGCFTTTFRSIASSARLEFTDLEVEALAKVHKVGSAFYFADIEIRPTLKIGNLENCDRALDLLERAETFSQISRALDLPLRFQPQVQIVRSEFSF